ncbi:MAG: biopolymer transporter ExbD [Halobacteriovoraceae bacterium]|nr:biopolymer transporter ExbD [Halobacteriovoraceae bacterium]MBC97874.1 biopolymer transporter ExbD [Halobacteriovoraceae bacterium]
MPDITPLIDVVFLLLIFFMVSTVFKKSEVALLLNLPEVSEAEAQGTADKVITIELSNEKMAYNGKSIVANELGDKLKAVTNKDIPIELRIDKDVKYEKVVKVLDHLKKNSLNNLSLITNNEKATP